MSMRGTNFTQLLRHCRRQDQWQIQESSELVARDFATSSSMQGTHGQDRERYRSCSGDGERATAMHKKDDNIPLDQIPAPKT